MAFKASPSSQHQHCTDEAQKAETVLSAVIYIYIYIYIYTHTHLFQKTLSGITRTTNVSCRAAVARPKRNVVIEY